MTVRCDRPLHDAKDPTEFYLQESGCIIAALRNITVEDAHEMINIAAPILKTTPSMVAYHLREINGYPGGFPSREHGCPCRVRAKIDLVVQSNTGLMVVVTRETEGLAFLSPLFRFHPNDVRFLPVVWSKTGGLTFPAKPELIEFLDERRAEMAKEKTGVALVNGKPIWRGPTGGLDFEAESPCQPGETPTYLVLGSILYDTLKSVRVNEISSVCDELAEKLLDAFEIKLKRHTLR